MVHEGRLYFELITHEYGIIPTIQHYGCIVDMLSRSGHLEEAKGVIERISLRSNEVIWVILLGGCRKHGNIEIGEYAAKRVMELDPNATGWYVFLSNIYAAAAGRWDDMAKVRKSMRWRGVRKDPGRSLINHVGVIHEFIVRDGSHPRTEEIYLKLDEMHQRLKCMGYEPDITQVLLHIDDSEKEAVLSYHSEKLPLFYRTNSLGDGGIWRT
ncbi:pentatricopeptide repeat-containing protein At5g48910-like [Amborella trichopoda]|uniref:pentatricopeptide repeat-containing protein At5g48910-like n=1 Tax=Amborella trichopoda TaxID=13333 RepID=UPI0005D3FE1B|nr:pentatricopeptide repeat-containing protein At5g48910-like [Amborella trichopoda]|eukprot:XP_011623659.1 pentatricopeptide repeat-containing protein At5g48910-like [Amborella trichopoda]